MICTLAPVNVETRSLPLSAGATASDRRYGWPVRRARPLQPAATRRPSPGQPAVHPGADQRQRHYSPHATVAVGIYYCRRDRRFYFARPGCRRRHRGERHGVDDHFLSRRSRGTGALKRPAKPELWKPSIIVALPRPASPSRLSQELRALQTRDGQTAGWAVAGITKRSSGELMAAAAYALRAL
jgi:hypothetical protein